MNQKNKKEDFLECYQTSLLGNLLTDKGTFRAGEGAIRAGYDF